MLSTTITQILANSSLTVDEKVEKITGELHSYPDKGIAESIEFIMNTDDANAASYPANYLALLPNLQKEKRKVVENILDSKPYLMSAITNLVKQLPDDVIERLIDDYFKDSSSSDLYNVIFEAASFFPEKLHTHAPRIEHKYIKELILPGGPDSWVDDLVNEYLKNKSPEYLKQLAGLRTDKALDALLTLAPRVPEEDLAQLYAYIESSGVFPNTRLASVYFQSYRGYVVSRGESPHHMGGSFPHPVPKCLVTNTPANRILTLDVSQVDLEIESAYNPSFFWYESDYSPDCLYVRFTEDGLQGIATPMTDGEVGTGLIPGELALKLEAYPLKYGRGGSAVPGYSNHQVGGYPSLMRFERFPRCAVCGKGMRFLVSIDSGMTPFGRLGFDGILYGFWCDDCAVSCTYRQSDDFD
ncbi:hypothetical protein IC235_13525 [Hymenobacter sp. BT664]|uniref:DUF1963 domain-containing protein n=1 Tax=Hymenobacter montanus TaxID=2771359 RepID=A0A927GK83_9BACT|nr:hypothetical protein [Hymenobacter montanus]MBD2768909.1 hypothetical protein [Hymenobacter montanus]